MFDISGGFLLQMGRASKGNGNVKTLMYVRVLKP